MEDLVSVIMPNYNCEQFLPETIESVLNQTYQNLELLIVDDCSTDNSVQIINSYAEKDSRIKLFINERNSGAAASRNWALREAKGKWIAFLDSDDVWLCEKLEKQIAFMEKNGYHFSCTEYEHINEESGSLNRYVTGPKKLNKRRMRNCCYPGCLTVIYDSQVIGLLQIPNEIGNGENDYALWLKAVKKADCYYLKEILARYRIRSSSLSHKTSRKKLMKNINSMYRILENRSAFVAALLTMRICFYTLWKKKYYVRKTKKR